MTLEDVKTYLRIDYEEDDILLISLIEISEEYIDSCVGTAYKTSISEISAHSSSSSGGGGGFSGGGGGRRRRRPEWVADNLKSK